VTQQSRQWQAWRRSAQSVTRTWNEWLAADRRQRDASYRAYISALTEEERAAAEVELMVRRGPAANDASACTGPIADPDAAGSAGG
jgi:hypothetical protein